MNQHALRLFVRSIITEAKEAKKLKKEEKAPKSSGKLVDLKKELKALETMKDELQAAKFAEKSVETEVEFANLAKFAKELDKLKAGGVALEASIDAKIGELKEKIKSETHKIKEMIGLASAPTIVDEKKDKKDKEEEEIEEARFPKGTDIGKKGKGFEKIEKSVEKKYIKSHTPSGKKPSETVKKHAEETGKAVAGSVLKKVIKKESIHNTAQMGGVTTSKGTAGYINKPDDQKGGAYDPKQRAANLAKLKDLGPKKK